MSMQDEILSSMSEKICADVTRVVQETLEVSVEKEVARALQKAIRDGDFYRTVNVDVQTGLNEIYGELLDFKKATREISIPKREESQGLLEETTNKLDSIIQITEQATLEIMDVVEKQMERIAEFEEQLSSSETDPETDNTQGLEFCREMNDDFLKIMTALSFQDITGQHIKKIISFIKRLEEMISKLYLSHDMVLKDKEQNPEKDIKDIKKDAQKKISQGDVDALLAAHGLE